MAQNKRIFFPTHVFGAAPFQSTSYVAGHGVQNLGITTNYTIEPISELGQLSPYQLIEQLPEIEVTAEKVLDGNPLLYHLCTRGAPDGSLIGRSNQRCQVAMSVYTDTQSSSSGTPTSETHCSGMYFSQSTFTFDTTRPFTESCSLVGNNKGYKSSGFDFTPNFTNNDVPASLAGSGGIQLRQNFVFYPILGTGNPNSANENASTLDANGQVLAFLTVLPPDIAGISSSGTNDRNSNGDFGAHISQVTVSCNLGRDAILELGRREPYFRFVQFPVQVTCEISTIATEADTLTASEAGYDGFGNNVRSRSIRIRATEGTFISLGTQNKLQTISFQGGGTDGGQVTTTYSYVTWNNYYVSHPQDPDHQVWPYII